MKNFKTIYPFEVIEHLKQGDYVGVLDREMKTAYNVRHLKVSALVDMLSYVEPDERYYFWAEESNEQI